MFAFDNKSGISDVIVIELLLAIPNIWSYRELIRKMHTLAKSSAVHFASANLVSAFDLLGRSYRPAWKLADNTLSTCTRLTTAAQTYRLLILPVTIVNVFQEKCALFSALRPRVRWWKCSYILEKLHQNRCNFNRLYEATSQKHMQSLGIIIV
jgi:hypothetical protein